jgi:hypothetical protein
VQSAGRAPRILWDLPEVPVIVDWLQVLQDAVTIIHRAPLVNKSVVTVTSNASNQAIACCIRIKLVGQLEIGRCDEDAYYPQACWLVFDAH